MTIGKVLDIDGNALKPGDVVQWSLGMDSHAEREERTVEAVRTNPFLSGEVMVTGFSAWQPASIFRKVTK